VPLIPDEVYGLLHLFFTRCVKHAANPRERDILLLLSTSLPARFIYSDFLTTSQKFGI